MSGLQIKATGFTGGYLLRELKKIGIQTPYRILLIYHFNGNLSVSEVDMERKGWLIFVFTVVVSLCFPAATFAADLSGSWSGHFYGDWSTTMQDIDLTIYQTGDVLETTSSYTVSGLTGNFSGTANGERFRVEFSHTYDTCNFSGTAEATLRGGVLVFEADGSDCNGIKGTARGAVVRSGSSIFTAGNWMNIEKRTYPSGVVKAALWASVDDSLEDIKSVAITTPRGAQIEGFVIDETEVPKRWETGYLMPLHHLEDVWPDGVYVYDITFNDERHEYCFSMLSGKFPSQYPTLTSHNNEDFIDPVVENTFEWDAWDNDPGSTGTIYLGLGDSFYEPKSSTSLTIPAGTLVADQMEDFGMNFHFHSSYRTAKNMTTEYYLRTGHHVVSGSWLMKAKVITQSGDKVGMIITGLDGVDIKSVQLKKPDDTIAFSLARGAEGAGEWEGVAVVSDIAQFDTHFPDGTYTLAITYSDDSVGNITKTISEDYPASYPDISAPLAGTTVEWNKDFQTSWSGWRDFAAEDSFIVASVSPLDNAVLPILKVNEVWGTDEGILVDGVLVPPGVLPPGEEYAVTILFCKGTSYGEWKATGRMRTFRSSVKNSGQFSWNLFLPAIFNTH